MKSEPKDILKKWINAINEGDIEGLLNLYDKKAILIPTFSNRLLNDSKKIRDYFEKLESYKELSIALHEKTLMVQPIENDKYALCGIYCWRFMVDEELLSFEARFSYFIDTTLERPIVHHHSSQIPRML
jgi:hypothetical protein